MKVLSFLHTICIAISELSSTWNKTYLIDIIMLYSDNKLNLYIARTNKDYIELKNIKISK